MRDPASHRVAELRREIVAVATTIESRRSEVPDSATYAYGVAHVDDGKVGQVKYHRFRDEAERDLADCHAQAAECYLVRRPVPEWERVPDGE